MLIDTNLELSSDQALTATAVSTNIIDLIQASRQIGAGKTVWVHFNVTVSADGTTMDETYQFDVETDDNAALSSAVVLGSKTIGYATLVAGYKFSIAIPIADVQRYVGIRYTLGGTTPSISMDAFMSDQEMQNSTQSYADALAPI